MTTLRTAIENLLPAIDVLAEQSPVISEAAATLRAALGRVEPFVGQAVTGPQRVIMTVGCPGAGKTTFARDEAFPDWVVLSLDDFRTALFRDKQIYHKNSADNPRMRALLNDAYEDSLRTALGYGFSAVLANMHIYPNTFASTLALLKRFGITPELRVFLVSFDELIRRNAARVHSDRVPLHFLRDAFNALHAADAWWRSYPALHVTTVGVEPCS